jgi:hypothetical protein
MQFQLPFREVLFRLGVLIKSPCDNSAIGNKISPKINLTLYICLSNEL